MTRALGLIEVIGLIGAIEAADTSLKSANIELIGISKVGSGIMTVKITGDVGAVNAAVDAGARAAAKITVVRSREVIPRIDETLIDTIVQMKKEEKKTSDETPKRIQINEIESINAKDIKSNNEDNSKIEQEMILRDSSSDFNNEKTQIEKKMVNEDNQDKSENEKEKFILELRKKSNAQLRGIAQKIVPQKNMEDLKKLRKQELIEFIENHMSEKKEEGDK